MKERIAKIKKHILDNRKVYISGGIGAAVGVLTTLTVRSNTQATLSASDGGVNNFVNRAKHVTFVTAELERRGHPGNIIRCDQTGEVFASQNRAASVTGINPGILSSHLNGKKADAGGFTFTNLGEAV